MKVYVVISRFGTEMNSPIVRSTREEAHTEMKTAFKNVKKDLRGEVETSYIDDNSATIETSGDWWEAEIHEVEVEI